MRIESVSSEYYLNNITNKNKAKAVPKTVVKDEYIPSSNIPDARNIALSSIKAKIKSGYYNSESVLEDVSDKLARLFDR